MRSSTSESDNPSATRAAMELEYHFQSNRAGRALFRATVVVSPTIDTVVWPGLSFGIMF